MATEYNGGLYSYADQATKKIFFRATDRSTKSVTIKSGQVIKAFSFLETDSAGRCIAHGGLVESATATFGTASTSGQTTIIAGLTFTAGSAGATTAQLATVWSGLADGVGFAAAAASILAAGIPLTVGTFTAGTLANYSTTSVSANKVRFDASLAASAADVAATGTGTAPTIVITQYAALNKIAGILLFDVDASAGEVDATAYQEASFWASALTWAVDVAVDVVTKVDGTTVAVTAYNTGCAGTSNASNLLKQKFVEGTEFEPLGFLSAGEQL